MKKGFIVWNMTNYGDGYEFFGVYRTMEQAEKCLRRVARARLGHCPRDYDKMCEEIEEYSDGCDSFRITPFEENGGEL